MIEMLVSPEFEQQVKSRLQYLMTDESGVFEVDCLAKSFYQYRYEEEFLKFLDSHPNATIKELWDFFDSEVPDGLPPGDDGEDDDE